MSVDEAKIMACAMVVHNFYCTGSLDDDDCTVKMHQKYSKVVKETISGNWWCGKDPVNVLEGAFVAYDFYCGRSENKVGMENNVG